MPYKIIAAAAFSALLSTSALAQSSSPGDPPTGFEIGDRAVFVNEQGGLREETEARDLFRGIPAERQTAMRDTCIAFREKAQPGSADLTDGEVTFDDPVPGVYNMYTACDWMDRF